MTTSDDALARLRAPHQGVDEVHLNHAGVAPTCRAAIEAGKRALDDMARGSLGVAAALKAYESARASFAAILGAHVDDVAFFQTAAAAITQVAFGLPLRADDEIVRLDQEYPSNAYPWHAAARSSGARVVVVPSRPDLSVDVDAIRAAIGPRTRVVALSWVQFKTGALVDLPPIVERARAVGAVVCVDAIQGVGALPFDLRALGVDYVCGGTHKWLLGPLGHGYLACARGRRDALQPLLHGAITYGTPDDPVVVDKPPRADRHRFEPGTPLLVGAVAGAAAIDELRAVGVERVQREATAVARLVDEGARRRGFAVLSTGPAPIVTFVPPGDVDALHARLTEARVSVAKRAGGVRVAPHCTSTPAHVARLFDVVDAG